MESQRGIWANIEGVQSTFVIRMGVSLFAVTLFVIHMLSPNMFPRDTIGIGLLIIAVLPWLVSVVAEAELPGGWRVKFREVAEEQQRQAQEIEWIKFLMRNFLTRYELRHLKRFVPDKPFWFDFNSNTKFYFERELRRLVDLNLLERQTNTGIRSLLYKKEKIQEIDGKEMKDVKQYLLITKQGKDYLKMRDDIRVNLDL